MNSFVIRCLTEDGPFRATAEAIVEIDAVSPAMSRQQCVKAAAATALMALLD